MVSPVHKKFKASKAVMTTRKAVKDSLADAGILTSQQFILVGLSGGADSLALAAAVAWVAERNSFTAGAIIVNHNLQEGSREVAETAAKQAESLGLAPVIIKDVSVPNSCDAGGPENAARIARYQAFEEVLDMTGASRVLTAHTKNDNAEQVLISIARGSGTRSLAGIRKERDYLIRPFLNSVSRDCTVQACRDQNLTIWNDPQNKHTIYTRVRVRETVIPVLQQELGEHVVDSLNRTAELAAIDADAFDWMVDRLVKDINIDVLTDSSVSVQVSQLKEFPEGILSRVVRKIIQDRFDCSITSEQTSNVVKLITNWHGQKFINTAGVTVKRADGRLVFSRTTAS